MDKPQIDYPCPWPYKVIGADRAGIIAAVKQLLADKPFELQESHQSKQGTYTSFNLCVQVQNEAERDEIFQALNRIPTVKMVI